MAINLDQGKARTTNGKPQGKTGAMVKPVAIPALKALEHHLDTQADNLEAQARQLVQTKMTETQDRVRGAVVDELAAIAGDDDFFGFGSMFDSPPILGTDEPPAVELPIEVLAVVA
jgi:hypothetical protein